MKRKLIYFLVIMLFNFLLLNSTDYSFSNYLPKVKKATDKITVKVDTLKKENDFYIYYRTSGLDKFQIRKMKRGKDGKLYYHLSTKNLYGKKIEYFILENKSSTENLISPIFTVNNFTKEESPEIYFQDTPPTSSMDSKTSRTPFYKFIRATASLSTDTRLYNQEKSEEQKYKANGNVSLSKNISNEKHEFGFKTDFSYLNPVYDKEKESNMNLTSMNIKYRRGRHNIEAGDLYVSNLDFTTSSINKRGFQYQYKGKNFSFGSFYTNSQQKIKFDGFGVPAKDANFFGATAGFHLGQEYNPIFKLRGMFLTGRDDLKSKTVVSTEEETFSKGEIISIGAEINLLKNHFKMKGEYVSSNFGKGKEKGSISKERDEAWFARAEGNYKILRADVDYKQIGTHFNSIANLFLQNDNKGLGSNAFLTIKSFTLHVGYTDKKQNLQNTELLPMIHTKFLKTDFNWYIANRFSIGAEYTLNNRDYDKSSGLQTGSEDMKSISYAGTLGYRAGNNGITIRLGKTESENFTSNIDGSVSVNLQLGTFLTFNPSFTYNSNENIADDSNTKIYNLYISSVFTFIPQLFSLSVSGSFRINENSNFDDEQSIGGTANLNFHMAKIFKNKISPTLIFKTKYNERKLGSTTTSNLTFYLQADISF